MSREKQMCNLSALRCPCGGFSECFVVENHKISLLGLLCGKNPFESMEVWVVGGGNTPNKCYRLWYDYTIGILDYLVLYLFKFLKIYAKTTQSHPL